MIKQPDYSSWLRKTYWRLDEAVALMLGIDPRQRLYKHGNQKQYEEYNERLDTATRSEGTDLQTRTSTFQHPMVELFGTDYAQVDPATFVQWANTKGYDIPDELLRLLDSDESETDIQPVNSMNEKACVVENRTLPAALPGDLKVIVDDVNQSVVVTTQDGEQTKHTRDDIVGRGTVTWDLLVAFAKCNGSLEENRSANVIKINTSVNRKNLGTKLVAALSLDKSPIVDGKSGAMCFRSIELAGSTASTDVMDRKPISIDDQGSEFLRRHGDDMPVPD